VALVLVAVHHVWLATPLGGMQSHPKKAPQREGNLFGQPSLRQPNVVTLALAAGQSR
jgi:hypothetical protein